MSGRVHLGAARRRERDAVSQAAEPAEDDAEDDYDDRTTTKKVLVVSFLQIFLASFYYTIVLPTSRLYAESLNAPKHFDGFMVGAAAVGSVFMNPVYRLMLAKSIAGTMHFQVACLQVGSVLYSLAQVAGIYELLIVGRLIGGMGASLYPIFQFIAEEVGKKHRSRVLSNISGLGKSFGFALGPIFAACLAYVDFNIGDLVVDKETNPGWTVAILCLFQTFLIVTTFPRRGSRLIGKEKVSPSLPVATNPLPLREKVLHWLTLALCVVTIAIANGFISAWQIATTTVIQLNFKWSVQSSALLVGGIAFTPAFVSPALGKLSDRMEDRKILIGVTMVGILSSVLLFDYGTPIPYLIGCPLVFNAFSAQAVFALSLSTKVAFISEVDLVMRYVGCTTILRAGGYVLGTYLSMNDLATAFVAGMSALLLGTLLCYRRMVPN
mmetsp:Transcript_7194/g.17742  ORF Transcript_7194/g.17742 Transcript_7194/m.17742 type:complete len:438 (-) Transcript_7194:108-1421(-)